MRIYISTSLAVACLAYAACCGAADNSREIERIKKEAQVAHPNDALSATKKANEDLSRMAIATNANNKPRLAASAFLGYYWKNVYGIPTFCQQQGKALPVFTRNFISISKPWTDAALKFLGMPKFDAHAKTRSLEQAREELTKVAEGKKTSINEICTMLEENSATVVERMKFSVVAPELHKQLLGEN